MLVVTAGAVVLVFVVALLSIRAARAVNRSSLAETPRQVTVVPAEAAPYRDERTYVGAVQPWFEASLGPQYVSAYVLTVLVRPGALVKRGEVLATLDCSNPSAVTRAVEMRARALDAQMRAVTDEATRLATMLDGGFAAPNDVEQKTAASHAAKAELLETKANLLKASLDVNDCVLRAPFDGEIGERTFDPGAFVHPGASIVTVVDRTVVRATVDAPEKDFDAIAPSTVVSIDVTAVGVRLSAPISRRAPRADPRTRTIHFEVDIPDPTRRYPVGTTAIVHVDVGRSVGSTKIPLYAATESQGKARLFVVDHDVAHARTAPVLGEIGGDLFLDPSALPAGTLVVTEGRSLLSDGDTVQVRVEEPGPHEDAGSGTRGGGYGRPL